MKTGVIGCGNMATAIIGGLIAGGFAAREDITASDRSDEQRRKLAAKFGVTTKADNKKCVENAEIVLFAVKPNVFPVIAEELRDAVKGKLIISGFFTEDVPEMEQTARQNHLSLEQTFERNNWAVMVLRNNQTV